MNVDYYNYNNEDDENIISESEKANKYLIDLRKIPKVKFGEVNLIFGEIDKYISPLDATEAYLSSYSEFSFLEYKYRKANGYFPNVFRIESISGNKFVGNLLKHYAIPDKAYTQYTYQDNDSPKMNGVMIAFQNDILLYFDSDMGCALYYDKLYEKNKSSILYQILGLLYSCKNPKVTKNKIYIVYRSSHGFDKMGFNIKKIDINLQENYNDDFIEKAEEIIRGLNDKDKSNLVILRGLPGVGKCVIGNTKITIRNKKTKEIKEMNIEDLM